MGSPPISSSDFRNFWAEAKEFQATTNEQVATLVRAVTDLQLRQDDPTRGPSVHGPTHPHQNPTGSSAAVDFHAHHTLWPSDLSVDPPERGRRSTRAQATSRLPQHLHDRPPLPSSETVRLLPPSHYHGHLPSSSDPYFSGDPRFTDDNFYRHTSGRLPVQPPPSTLDPEVGRLPSIAASTPVIISVLFRGIMLRTTSFRPDRVPVLPISMDSGHHQRR